MMMTFSMMFMWEALLGALFRRRAARVNRREQGVLNWFGIPPQQMNLKEELKPWITRERRIERRVFQSHILFFIP
jgi:hypothetical protein